MLIYQKIGYFGRNKIVWKAFQVKVEIVDNKRDRRKS